MFLLTGLWLVAATWVLASPWTTALLTAQGLVLPDYLAIAASRAVRWTLPAVLWTLGIYDAITGAERGR